VEISRILGLFSSRQISPEYAFVNEVTQILKCGQGEVSHNFWRTYPRIIHPCIAFASFFREFLPVVWTTSMIANYYTLRHIAVQLNQQLKGWIVREVFSQNKNELILSFEAPTAPTARAYLIVRCEPSENCLFVIESFARAKRNSVDLFPQIIGLAIGSVSMHDADRQIILSTESGVRLLIQMFGSRANVLLVQNNNEISDSFLRSREIAGQTYTERVDRESVADKESFLRQLRGLDEMPIGLALKKLFPFFGSILLTELFHRTGMARSETIDHFSDDEILRLFVEGRAMIVELRSTCVPRIYCDGANALVFSIIDLQHCGQYEKREFDSLSEAIRTYLGTTKSLDRAAREKARIHQGLNKELERVTRTLVKISQEAESADRAGEYERMGELLKAHLHELGKGMTEAIVENTLDGSNQLITVPLDKNLTPAKNADRYFEKAKKSRIAMDEKKKQKTRLTQEQSALTTALGKFEALSSTDELDPFLEEHREILHFLGLAKVTRSKKSEEEEVPFRVYRVAGDFVVWAGKNGENNDLLSTRYTKSKDLWFHARAVGGSHVVLKFGTGKGEMSKHAIDEAAGIAAYYSKMKSSKLVPVSMCEGKYVRKPKGAPAGTVTIEREKIIFVEPRLPMN
jgi:predicted ribosome quality control (RQC) complex YloA/Tae2 family protein